MTAHILYLHGFNSSPRSFKAQAMARHMKVLSIERQLTIADIPAKPSQAKPQLEQLADGIAQHAGLCCVGSSLGGFYATWLAERHGCCAVLINPAVRPHERLQEYLGENRNYYTGDSWEFTTEDLDTLREMALPCITRPERYRVLLQSGDETLDYRQAEAYYSGTDMHVEQGGDHAFQGFEDHIDAILRFCGCKA